PRSLPVRRGIQRAVADRELDACREEPLVDVERLLRDVAEGRLVALPAERTDREIGIDADDTAGVERAVRLGRDAPKRDPLRDERLLDAVARGPRARACGLGLGAQLGAHLAGQTGDRAEAEHVRRIPLIGAADLLAVAPHERVLRLGPGAVGAALRVA